MIDFLFSSIWGWMGLTSIIVMACVAVAWLFPQLRLTALAVAGAAVTATGIYTKGQRDRAKEEARKKEQAVQEAQNKFRKIDERPDTPNDVERKLEKGEF